MTLRLLAVLTVLCIGIGTGSPAFSGTATLTDGAGTWRSTACKPPVPPAVKPIDPEAAAEELNKARTAENAYALAAQDYMRCLSEEAQKDAGQAGQVITSSAQGEIKAVQKQVDSILAAAAAAHRGR